MRTPPLTPTGRVILGMIALGRQTGYDIKQFVDQSTRHFWAASYGQIYPELRRLEEQGLVRGQSEPTGGRPARSTSSPTPAGGRPSAAGSSPARDPIFEVRDEGMLKLFFSDMGTPEQRIRNLRRCAMPTERRSRSCAALAEKARGHLQARARADAGARPRPAPLDRGWCDAADAGSAEEGRKMLARLAGFPLLPPARRALCRGPRRGDRRRVRRRRSRST